MSKAKSAGKKRKSAGQSRIDTLDSHWHLARTDKEIGVTELEFSLLRVFAAFDRWQSECLATVAHQQLSSLDNEVLHIIRLKERPKTLNEVARLLNRDDLSNLQYSIRKLLKAGLIEKQSSDVHKGIVYKVSKRGLEITEAFAKVRADLLMGHIPSVEHWDEHLEIASRVLDLLRGTYEQAALFLVTHRTTLDNK